MRLPPSDGQTILLKVKYILRRRSTHVRFSSEKMKNKDIKSHAHLLEFINGLPNAQKHKYIVLAPKTVIMFLSDLCYNVLIGNVKLDTKTLLKLKSKKHIIESLCEKNISLKKRRKIILKKNFFTSVIAPIIPALLKHATK